jgi:Tol biopolymer transport system component
MIAMRNGHKQLWLRRLDTLDAQPIAGSENASDPFWSPDSRQIAFFVPGKLKKVAVSGGTVTDICAAGAFSMGGAWSPRGVIVFSIFGAALKRVPENGGVPEPITGAELSHDAVGQQWPGFLPDGTHFLYQEWQYPIRSRQESAVWIGSLDGEKARQLPLRLTNAQYSAGYLLFGKEDDLVAQKFDLAHLTLGGPVFPVARNIQYDTFFQGGMFSSSTNGTLVYAAGGVGVNTQLTWLDRQGKTIGLLGETLQFTRQSISPDGKRVAVGIKPTDARETIWIYDVNRGTRTPVENSESGPSLYGPVWSPDGKQLAYRAPNTGTSAALLIHAADGTGDEKRIGEIQADVLTATDWSSDGRHLAIEMTRYQGRENWENSVHVVDAASEKSVFEISNASGGKFSPDGHWLLYNDDASGEVYVTSFPGPGARIAVSSGGGGDPRWRGDGQELFYVSDDMSVVSVRVQESVKDFHVISSTKLFRLQLPYNVGFYDVTRDGQHFLVNARTAKEQSAPLTLMTNWMAAVEAGSGQGNPAQ